MNTGIVMIGLALVLLSAAMLVTPSTAIVTTTGVSECCGNNGFTIEPLPDNPHGESVQTDSYEYWNFQKTLSGVPALIAQEESNQPHISKTSAP